MRVTIYQPRYLPQLHYFNRMLIADTFVFLDDAQYTKSLRQVTPEGEKRVVSYQSDTPIKTAQGRILLTVPIRHDGYSPLNTVQVDYSQNWHRKHLLMIRSAYQHADHFPTIYESLKKLLPKKQPTLASMNMLSTLWGLSMLLGLVIPEDKISIEAINAGLQDKKDIRLKKIILGSTLGVKRPEGLQKGTEWTTAICLAVGASEYVHGGTAKENYMDIDYYMRHGITPVMQDWKCEKYPQGFSKLPYIPNLSIVDLLCNVERKKALKIIL